MQKEKKQIPRERILIILAIATCVLLGIRLFWIQVIKHDYYSSVGNGTIVKTVDVQASRGEILDRNGIPLVSNRQANALVFDASYFPAAADHQSRSDIILSLIKLLEQNGEAWIDTIPIVINASGEPEFEEDRESDIARMKSNAFLDLNDYATAQNCMDALIEMYELEDYSLAEARNIASVRYGMVMGAFSVQNPYKFAEDVSTETTSVIKENSMFYKGVDVEIVSVREYANGAIAPHLLGTIGAINAEEYDELQASGYGMNDTLGKSGIEKAMEKYLRGTNGTKTVYTNANDEVSSEITEEPEQGNTVILTIDKNMQDVAQNALKEKIDELRRTVTEKAAGAVVAIDVKTGEILTSATYPSYDLSTYAEDYADLVQDETAPLWDRSVLSAYAPGSTFKPAMAVAGLEEGAITESTTFYCTEVYHFNGMTLRCSTGYHGSIAVKEAINQSCNIFFYELSQELGIDNMNKYAVMFGLGQSTGVEVNESKGTLAGRGQREDAGGTWYPGDTVQAAIGQSDNAFTPVQLANYAATIANGGTRYSAHFVKTVNSYDYGTTIIDNQPTVAYDLPVSDETFEMVREGMRRVGDVGGFCYSAFRDLPVKAAAKTGTSQVAEYNNGVEKIYNNGVLISYAPADDPQIAVAIIIERADSGSSVASIAAEIYDYYFNQSKTAITDIKQATNTLLG